MKRRKFITAVAGVAGIAALDRQVSRLFGAEAPPRKTRAEIEKILADTEVKGREFFGPPKEEGQFLSLLVKMSRAKNILFLGAGFGIAAIWLALGLEETDGNLTAIELLHDRLELAKKHLAEASLAPRVTWLEGDAHKLVPTLAGPFDLVYLDADKSGQLDYFRKLHPQRLAPGALLVAHNAITRREAMQDYLDTVTAHPDFDTILVRTTEDDGFAVSYQRRV